MEIFAVTGGARLAGTATVTGAKNSALKLMAAALLAEGTSTISAVPDIADVAIMGEVLRRLGCNVELDRAAAKGTGSARIEVPQKLGTETDYDLVRRMRAAICVLGPLLARFGEATVPLPGGDNIGSRGLDLHIAGLNRLGADIRNEHGFLIATADRLAGATVWLDFPSVGATENLLMASVLAKGTTVIDNAAREPEIVDLVSMLVAMGARIDGGGTSTLEIVGVEGLNPVQHTTVPDRVVAGTLAYGAVMTGGDVHIVNGRIGHLDVPLGKLIDAGAEVSSTDEGFRIVMNGRPTAVDIVTLPYPGFPTDLQPMAVGLAAVSEGSSMITENVFEARFMFVNELVRLGAEVQVDGHHVVIRGRERLSSAPVEAHDIRAGAGLVLAGLVADGRTEVSGGQHIIRGYPDFAGQLRALGADVTLETIADDP
ncbi:MAG: UDP-N-acetylglucosamine 1-carboxyvinyltransferase [Actinomycetota bacterium]|nr:UDP-N-acetylglucosamine 1-carboxyvinyltransferase [Actinomycetota bacterium]